MTWKRQLWGVDHPTPGRIVAMSLLWVTAALMTTGLFVDFVPADGLHGGPAIAVFLFVGLVVTVACIAYGAMKGRPYAPSSGMDPVIVAVVLPPFLGVVFWLALVKGMGWTYTRVLGSPGVVHATLVARHSTSRRSCHYRLEGPPLDASFPDDLCIPESIYMHHPDQPLAVALHGRMSMFGFAITRTSFDAP